MAEFKKIFKSNSNIGFYDIQLMADDKVFQVASFSDKFINELSIEQSETKANTLIRQLLTKKLIPYNLNMNQIDDILEQPWIWLKENGENCGKEN